MKIEGNLISLIHWPKSFIWKVLKDIMILSRFCMSSRGRINITLKGISLTWSHFVSNFSGELTCNTPLTYHDLVRHLHLEPIYMDDQQHDEDKKTNLVSHIFHQGHKIFCTQQPFQ